MGLLNGLRNATNFTYTENGAVAHKTTKSAIVDFFSTAGAMRGRSDADVINMFMRAFGEDKLITVKLLYYFRDIREGQGERRLFKTVLKYLANTQTEIVIKNLHLVSEYGRWDDLLCLLDTPCKREVINLISKQLVLDTNCMESNQNISLMAKWLPSLNASSKSTKWCAKVICEGLGLSAREYRKTLSKMRSRIRIVENNLRAKNYEGIDYSTVPSCANKKYLKAFWRNDEERYSAFINAVKKGERKVNTKTLYPYELVKPIIHQRYNRYGISRSVDSKEVATLNMLWENLPNYVAGSTCNAITVIDTSGSMYSNDCLPISVAISLGIYFSERSKGAFANSFITFSETPSLIDINGQDMATKVQDIMRTNIIANTNIKAVFDLMLQIATTQHLNQEEIPDRVIIVSDMQFDSCTRGINNDTKRLFDYITESWGRAGYQFPKLIFWNVDAKRESFPMTIDDAGVQFVSGFSPTIFTSILQDKFKTPMDLVMDVVNKERYDLIHI